MYEKKPRLPGGVFSYDKGMERDDFPKRLYIVSPKIKKLWTVGNKELLHDLGVKLAIVGSRRMTEYGRRVLESFMPTLVASGVTIVSGMMYGVDQEAHKLCLKYGGKTIAVLGFGINNPKTSREDGQMIEKIVGGGGLVISEWESEEGNVWTFPARNRIVVGLADAVLVIEADEVSGSMVTVKWANKYKKPVYAIPGQIFSHVSRGTNRIIANGSAKMVVSVEELIDSIRGILEINLPLFGEEKFVEDGLKARIIKLIEGERFSTDEIIRILSENASEVNVALCQLSMASLVEEKEGRWCLSDKMRKDVGKS